MLGRGVLGSLQLWRGLSTAATAILAADAGHGELVLSAMSPYGHAHRFLRWSRGQAKVGSEGGEALTGRVRARAAGGWSRGRARGAARRHRSTRGRLENVVLALATMAAHRTDQLRLPAVTEYELIALVTKLHASQDLPTSPALTCA